MGTFLTFMPSRRIPMSEGSTITLFCRFWHFSLFTKSRISYDTNEHFSDFWLLGKKALKLTFPRIPYG